MQPPKPPPVIRAPNTPGCAAASLDRGIHHRCRRAVQSRRLAWPSIITCPAVARSPPAQRSGELADSLVLGDHVASPGADDRIGDRRDVVERRDAQRADRSLGGSALGDPLGVWAADQRAVGDELDDDDASSGIATGCRRQLVAVDQQRVALHRRGDAQLVHDAARHARRPVLGTRHELGQSDRRHLRAERQRRPPPRARRCWTVRHRSGCRSTRDRSCLPVGRSSATTPAT